MLRPSRLFSTPRTVASQAPLSMGFPRQENWNGLPFPRTGSRDGKVSLVAIWLQAGIRRCHSLGMGPCEPVKLLSQTAGPQVEVEWGGGGVLWNLLGAPHS